MRWLSDHRLDGNSGTPGSQYGRLVAIEKRTGTIAWTVDLAPRDGYPAWGNVDPLVWANPESTGPREVILTGDTSGQVSAWRQGTGPRGEPHGLFIVRHAPGRPDDESPMPCADLEGTGATAPHKLSARVRLTDKPYFNRRTPWSNASGVATGMTLVDGRLLMGVNEETPETSKLVALRIGTNTGLGSATVRVSPAPGEPLQDWPVVREGGQWRLGAPVKPGARIEVAVPVRFELQRGRAFSMPVLWGWDHEAPHVQPVAARGPDDGSFPVQTLHFTYRVPDTAATGVYRAKVLANPGLYDRRWDSERLRPLPRSTEVRGEPPPAEWAPYVDAAAADPDLAGRGEVWVLDNFWSLTVPVGAEPPLANFRLEPEVACPGQPVRYVDLSTDPGGLPLRAEWTGRRDAFDRPGRHEVGLRVTNSAGLASPWAFRQIEILPGRECTPGEDARITAVFDPNPAPRGEHVNMSIQINNVLELRDFVVQDVQVLLPPPLERATVQFGYGSVTVDNTAIQPEGAGPDWSYHFQVPWSGPDDGPYYPRVAASGTFTQVHIHWVPVCTGFADADGDGVRADDEPCDEWTDTAEEHLHRDEPWGPEEAEFRFVVSGTRQLVTPLGP